MRRVDRGAVEPPSVLLDRGKAELTRAEKHFSGSRRDKAFPFAVYRDPSVKQALERLFYGKCAYCESPYGPTQPVDVEHYRPKGAVEGIEHRGYWWLAMRWENLLPSCIDCNRSRDQKVPPEGVEVFLLENGQFNRTESLLAGKGASFPLVGGVIRATSMDSDLAAERRLLLDPTHDNPDEHLEFYVRRKKLVSIIHAKAIDDQRGEALVPAALAAFSPLTRDAKAAGVSAMGVASIRYYGLNRLGLVQARTKILLDLEFLLDLSRDLIALRMEAEARIEAKKGKPADGSLKAGDPTDASNDTAFESRIVSKLNQFIQQTQQQIRTMTLPQSAYSRVARAWVDAYVNPRADGEATPSKSNEIVSAAAASG